MKPICALAAGLAIAVAAPAADASEDDRAFSVSLNYGRYTLDEDISPDGGVVGFDYEHGISDPISLRASAGGGLYYQDGPAYSGHAVVGVTYLFDVLKYVPYANIGAGGIVLGGDGFDTQLEPLIEIGFGVDFLRSREFSWGVLARYETYFNETSFFTAGARLTWRWGFF
jgi:hypothetical protein